VILSITLAEGRNTRRRRRRRRKKKKKQKEGTQEEEEEEEEEAEAEAEERRRRRRSRGRKTGRRRRMMGSSLLPPLFTLPPPDFPQPPRRSLPQILSSQDTLFLHILEHPPVTTSKGHIKKDTLPFDPASRRYNPGKLLPYSPFDCLVS
jgi:hypothetical protein